MCGPKFCSMRITQDIRAAMPEGEDEGRLAATR
jgi:hypothetical protein